MFNRYRLMDEVDPMTGAGGEGSGGAEAPAAQPQAAASEEPAKPSLTDKERELLAEVMDKKEKLKALQGQLSETATKLKAWDGLNPDEVRALLEERKAAEQKQLEKKGEFDKVKQQIIEQHQSQLKTLEDRIAELSNQLQGRDTVIDQLTVGQAFAQSKFIAEELVLTPSKARTVYGAHFERDSEGRVIGYDKPAGSPNRAPLVDAKGEPLSFEAALAKLVDMDPEKESLKKAKVAAGAGSGTVGAKVTEERASSLSGRALIAASLSQGGLKKFSRG